MTPGTSVPDKFFSFVLVLVIAAVFLSYDLYNLDMYQCETPIPVSKVGSVYRHQKWKLNKLFGIKVLDRDYQFDMNGNDVMVFLHIQKTGGTTFGKHLVKHLGHCRCERGKKRCDCKRKREKNSTWLFSRYSTGWSCGLHADWTELTSCVPKLLEKNQSDAKSKKEKKKR